MEEWRDQSEPDPHPLDLRVIQPGGQFPHMPRASYLSNCPSLLPESLWCRTILSPRKQRQKCQVINTTGGDLQPKRHKNWWITISFPITETTLKRALHSLLETPQQDLFSGVNFSLLCVLSCLAVSNSATPWTVAHQDSSVHRIFQARTVNWVAISHSSGSSRPRDRTCLSWVSCTGSRFFTTAPPGSPSHYHPL